MPSSCRIAIIVLLASGLSPVLPALAESGRSTFDAAATFHYDSNINRVERDNLREGDGIFNVGAKGAYRRQVTDNSGIVAALGADVDVHTDIGDLDAARAKVSLSYLLRPFSGFSRPWFALTGAFQLHEYAASDIRDGTESSVGLEAGQLITDRISARVGFTIFDRDARKSRAFEQHRERFHFIGDYAVNDRVNAYLKYAFTWGSFVTTSPRNPRLRGNFRAVARDAVFGNNALAWRMGGESHELKIGSKYSLAKHTALDLSASHAITEVDGDNQWNVWNIGLSISHRFK